ncbi:MAG: tRNA 2-thiocytidine biosynthesis TtcA family protein [Roseburia sp.]|nr:tRNA 2-thiocytidine biosynthesis TtcA family protein [Anaeroplasma bactoclasticum]MCM1196327.1 tRNA 2-thiocytidine biosynthesis TtcA family protein [Roseburia sp.]MCM1557562.1 tRNA 2-thiocytidine biosynthesis TtcA family protein [Anaeroplasma bactoclasticum]
MERYQEIERTIIKTYRAHLWAPFVKALKEYKLLSPNDKVCVCISGGKDSMLLAKLFQELKRHSDFEFEVKYLVMNPGYSPKNLEQIENNLKLMHIDAEILNTDIFAIANAQEKNPCYLCAKMRRGALYKLAQELGCNKIALGHHFDDVIETTLMNMLNSGSFQTMLPKLHSENYPGMELIRPMYYIRERDIIRWSNYNELKFINCACRFTEGIDRSKDLSGSKRYDTKILIKELLKYNPLVEKNIFKSTYNVNLNKIIGYKKDDIFISFLDDYDK